MVGNSSTYLHMWRFYIATGYNETQFYQDNLTPNIRMENKAKNESLSLSNDLVLNNNQKP